MGSENVCQNVIIPTQFLFSNSAPLSLEQKVKIGLISWALPNKHNFERLFKMDSESILHQIRMDRKHRQGKSALNPIIHFTARDYT